jgi:hypothetical protein
VFLSSWLGECSGLAAYVVKRDRSFATLEESPVGKFLLGGPGCQAGRQWLGQREELTMPETVII